MNSLCIIDKDWFSLKVNGYFDGNGEVEIHLEEAMAGCDAYAWLTRPQVAQLRDHLNKLLESSIAQVK